MSAGIYKITSPSGKVYVGMTNDFEDRKKKHIIDAKNRNGKFQCAIKKYGAESFVWEILHICNERSEAAKLEQLEIINHDSFRNGYNMTTGGEGVSGLPRDPEVDKRRGQTRSKNMGLKPINVFKKDDLEYVGTWDMKSECEKDLGFSNGRIAKHFYKSSKAIGEYYVTTDPIESVLSRKMELLQWINTSENKGKPKWNKGVKYTPEQCQRIFGNRKNKLKEEEVYTYESTT